MVTTLEIPDELKIKAEEVATARGLSLDEFIREVLEWALSPSEESDPLFADDAVYAGMAPADLSTNHDRYLYGEDA